MLSVVLMFSITALGCGTYGRSHKSEIGIHLHFRGDDAATIGRQFDLMSAMGLSWVRVDLSWAWIETVPGQYDWTSVDTFVDEAQAHRINVLAVVATTPPWARSPDSSENENPPYSRAEDLSKLQSFVQTAVSRYFPRGLRTWEVWNEPNIEHFWPSSPDANEYGELFRVVASAIRGVDHGATLLTGGLSPKYDGSNNEVAPRDYLEQLYANGTAQLADGIALHPYSFPAMPMAFPQRMVGGFSDLPELHDVMAKHGDARKKIWITEYGAPTGTGQDTVSEDDQARALLEARQQVAAWDWIGPLIYYELTDDGTDLTDAAKNFGVLRANLDPKPAATALIQHASDGGR